MYNQVTKKLIQLTGHSQVVLTPSGNSAIFTALSLSGKKKVLIPDQGGWLTYPTYPGVLGKNVVEIKTKNALIDLGDLKDKADADSVLLYDNPGGYFVEEPIQKIFEICQTAGAQVILDCTGGLGTDMCDGKYADFLVASFGEDKPVNAGYGGFISLKADSNKETIKTLKTLFPVDESKLETIFQKLESLPQRINFLSETRKKVLTDLKSYNIIYPQSRGYTVVIRCDKETRKEIEEYCQKNNLEWTPCPRYIRLMDEGISIEIKRL